MPEEDLELDPDLRVVTPMGRILIFSRAQLPSRGREYDTTNQFNIDFRTSTSKPFVDGFAAPNLDSECTATATHDFLRPDELSSLDDKSRGSLPSQSRSAGRGRLTIAA